MNTLHSAVLVSADHLKADRDLTLFGVGVEARRAAEVRAAEAGRKLYGRLRLLSESMDPEAEGCVRLTFEVDTIPV